MPAVPGAISAGGDHDAQRERSPAPEHELAPVVAAVVTSPMGVLVTHRVDGTPPWGFVAGKVEPGEPAADAAVREVREETGLDVTAGRELGRRVHPDTGRTMIYVSAGLSGHWQPEIGDPVELDAVRWIAFDEAPHLMPGVFAPVLAYLERESRRQVVSQGGPAGGRQTTALGHACNSAGAPWRRHAE